MGILTPEAVIELWRRVLEAPETRARMAAMKNSPEFVKYIEEEFDRIYGEGPKEDRRG